MTLLGPTHLFVLAVYGAGFAALGVAAAELRGSRHERTLRWSWGAFVVLVQAVNIVYFATPPRLKPSESLPLHFCDLTGIIAAVAIFDRRRLWCVLLYYWGIGLSSQAFLTPVVEAGPATFRFHLFFLSHFTLIGTGVYVLAAGWFRPAWRDCLLAIAVTLAYFIVMIPVNVRMDWNYGYIGDTKPQRPTLIDRLGPWPVRLVWLFLIGAGGFALMTLPWTRGKRASRGL
jgi:hypothetical integral membrane protein (TIGR02206 family)